MKRSLILGLLPALCLAASPLKAQESPSAEQLQRQVSALQEQFKKSQEENQRMLQLLQALQKQVGELQQAQAAAKPPTSPAAAKPPGSESSVDDIFKELGGKPPAPAAAAQAGAPAVAQPQTADDIARAVGQSEGSQLPWFRALNNPSFGAVVDVLANASDEDNASDRRNRIDLRELEFMAYGSIDPFAHASALISGADGVSVEEAVLTLTALPGNLQLRGGRFFADVSRLNKTHTHDLPFIEQPLTMQNFLGRLDSLDQRAWWLAEPQFNAEGAELSWVVPTPFYWRLQLSVYNEFSDRSSGSFWDQYLGGPDYQSSYRGLDDLTYHLGTRTFFELSPNQSLRFFANVLVDAPSADARRITESGGFSYLWYPLEGGLYKGLEWTTEVFANQERFLGRIPTQNSWGIYSYVNRRLGRRFDVGLLGEWSTFRFDDGAAAWHAGTWLSYYFSERHRIRFGIDRFGDQQWLNAMSSHTGLPAGDGNYWLFGLQWNAVLGSHEHTYE
jgi:hypothetical protein